VGGPWQLENGELVQPKPERAIIHFGDPNWTDYTLELEGQSKSGEKGGQGPMVLYRVQDSGNFREFVIGAYGATATESTLHKNGAWSRVPGAFLKVPHEHDRWYKIKIEAKGANVSCSVDGKAVFTHGEVVPSQGMIGLATWNSSIRYRNLKVTAPDGAVLWEGFPEFAAAAPKSADAERKALEWVLSVGGSLVVQSGSVSRRLKRGDSIPDGPLEVHELSLLEAASVDDASIENLKAVSNVTGTLYLMNNLKFGDAGLAKLAAFPGLAGIRHLTLTGKHAVTEAGFQHVKSFSKLTNLVLGGPGVTDATIETVVRELPMLTILDLTGPVTAKGIRSLNASKLLQLGLYECHNIDDAALDAIAESLAINQLGLSFTPVSDAGLERLAKSKSLKTVTFNGCNVRAESLKRPLMTDAGLKKLAAAKPELRIELDGKKLDAMVVDPDRRAAEFILNFPRDHGIQIQLDDVDVWYRKVEHLPKRPFRLTGLHVEWASKLDDAALANFAGCKHLKTLKIWGAPVTDKGLVHFAECRDLETLEFTSNTVNDAALKMFEPCTKITRIALNSKNVSDEGMTAFRGRKLKFLALAHSKLTDRTLDLFPDCPDLTVLSLFETRITGTGLKNFRNSKKLTQLILARTRVSDDDLATFAGSANITLLDLTGCTGISDKGLAHFRDCRGLEEIKLDYLPQITDAGIAHFVGCKNVALLHLHGTAVTDDGLKVFKGCKNLGLLNLSATKITAAGLAHFKDSASLGTLYLSMTKLGDESIDAIAAFPALRIAQLTDTRVTAEGRKKLKELLPNAKVE